MTASTGFFQHLTTDPEFLLYRTNPHWSRGGVAPERYFRLVAFMAPPLFDEREWQDDEGLQRLGSYANRAYNQRVEKMHRCVLLPGSVRTGAEGQVLLSDDAPGAVWWDESETEATIFTFRHGEVDLGKPIEQVREIETREQQSVQGSRFSAQAYRVYVAARQTLNSSPRGTAAPLPERL